jgi:hypothetical protein
MGGYMIKEAQDVIEKRANDIATQLISDSNEQLELTKQAEDIVKDMSKEALDKYAEAEAFGRGVAYGQTMFKQASLDEISEAVYKETISGISAIFGVKVAEEINQALFADSGQDENAENEIVDVAENAAAEVLVNAYGGADAVMANEELKQQVITEAAAIGNQVKEEVVEAMATGAPEEAIAEEAPAAVAPEAAVPEAAVPAEELPV